MGSEPDISLRFDGWIPSKAGWFVWVLDREMAARSPAANVLCREKITLDEV
jgi:hypothetical protein